MTHSLTPTKFRARLSALACFAALLFALSTRAEPTSADELFHQGKALMEASSFSEACDKFARSVAIARRGGALLNLAVCREKEGKFASALHVFSEARELAVQDRRSDRVALIEEHIQALRPKLSWLTIRPAQPSLPTLSIRCDGEQLRAEDWGKPLPIDRGVHHVSASAPERAPLELSIAVPEGDSQTLEIPELSAEAQAAPTSLASSATFAITPNVPQNPSKPAEPARPVAPQIPALKQRARAEPNAHGAAPTAAWLLLGAGATSFAVGSAFGIKAMLDEQASRDHCPRSPCGTTAYRVNESAKTEARVADFTLPLGLVAAGSGVYWLLRSRAGAALQPNSTATSALPLVGAHAGGIVMRGAW